jgi:hypothetical protein
MLAYSTRPLWGAALAVTVFGALPLNAADLDPFVPPDTESYVAVNVRRVLDSAFAKKIGIDRARQALKDAEGVGDVLNDLGFDPFKDLDRVVIATPGGTDPDRGLVIVHGKFNLEKFKKKAEEAARENADVLKIRKVPDGARGQITLYEVTPPGADMTLYVALASNTTLLASSGKDYVIEALKQARAKKKPVLKNKDFQSLLEKMDARQSVSLAVLGKAIKGDLIDSSPRVKEALAKIEALGGGLTIGEDVKFELVIAAKEEKSAKALRGSAEQVLKWSLVSLTLLSGNNKALDILLEVVKSVKVTSRDKVVTIKAEVNPDTIKELLDREESDKDEDGKKKAPKKKAPKKEDDNDDR